MKRDAQNGPVCRGQREQDCLGRVAAMEPVVEAQGVASLRLGGGLVRVMIMVLVLCPHVLAAGADSNVSRATLDNGLQVSCHPSFEIRSPLSGGGSYPRKKRA
jgi:hypothetical protein